MARWLYQHVFRGIGFVMVVAMITILYVTITSQLERDKAPKAHAVATKAAR